MPPRSIRRTAGTPERAILEAASLVRAQILVLGSSLGVGVLAHLPGNTLWHVIEQASADILVIKPALFHSHFSMHPRGAQMVSAARAPLGFTYPPAAVVGPAAVGGAASPRGIKMA
jgi:hypothetical protein